VRVQLSAIDVYRSFAKLNQNRCKDVDTDFANEFLEVLSTYLDSECDNIKQKACVSLRHVLALESEI
jgi:hypothetical protein